MNQDKFKNIVRNKTDLFIEEIKKESEIGEVQRLSMINAALVLKNRIIDEINDIPKM